MRRTLRRLLVLGSIVAVAAAVRRRLGRAGVATDAGILIENAPAYDRLADLLLGGLYAGIAADVAAVAAAAGPDARVLDVGCGPGHLLERLADRGLAVTGVDLDPAMVERARVRLGDRAEVLVADAAGLPFGDGAFDVVVSTLSMHHWADTAAGVAELARVLRPDGRAVLFDLDGRIPLHGDHDGPARHLDGSALAVVADSPWRWPGPVSFVRRVVARRA